MACESLSSVALMVVCPIEAIPFDSSAWFPSNSVRIRKDQNRPLSVAVGVGFGGMYVMDDFEGCIFRILHLGSDR